MPPGWFRCEKRLTSEVGDPTRTAVGSLHSAGNESNQDLRFAYGERPYCGPEALTSQESILPAKACPA
jgi:hypothetical protein